MLAQYNFLDDVTRESAILKDSKVSKSTWLSDRVTQAAAEAGINETRLYCEGDWKYSKEIHAEQEQTEDRQTD